MAKVSLRTFVDKKVPETMQRATFSTATGSHVVCEPTGEDRGAMVVYSASNNSRYDHKHDAFQSMPAFGYSGTFGAGSCSEFHPMGPRGNLIALGAGLDAFSNVRVPLTLNWKLFSNEGTGYKIRFTSGPCAGLERMVIDNTIGSNSCLTLDSPLPIAPTTATKFVLISGTYYGFNAGAKGFAKYDRATNVVTQLSIANLPATWGTDGQLVATCLVSHPGFSSGTATGGAPLTVTDASKNWAASEWIGYQVRIISGNCAGEVRRITASAAQSLTLASALPSAIAAGDRYIIEGDEDSLYLFGNASGAVYRYSISSNAWDATPFATIPVATGAGLMVDWIFDVPGTEWAAEPNVKNGRYFYIFIGGGSRLFVLDISTKTATENIYVPRVDTFSSGSGAAYLRGGIYIAKENTGLIFKFDVLRNRLVPYFRFMYPQGTNILGDKLWPRVFTDKDGSELVWLYYLFHSSDVLQRVMMLPD